ncbi:hypothetical protein G210_5127 [Candida maltosa Xu316]|uniref:Glutamine amidotransferase type-2 domain-containing protein n=1 Tax=Candida maltosa (strain Xu316) TaxID=1245528 RepID=M3K571_CANMX|nr:hypothetical protein G210_5127 [Candida maltosa Xu316]
MCGILFKVSKSKLEPPSCIPQPLTKNNDIFQTWETLDPETIQHFLDEGSKVPALSKQQIYKLENLSHIRDLNNELSKIKNNVKTDPSMKTEKINQIQTQIDSISKEDEVPLTKDNMDDLIYKISNRGPNYLNYTEIQYNEYHFQLFSSILSLRQPFTKQPIVKDDFILQFNGELYNQKCLDLNDTQFIIDELHDNLQKHERNEAILKTLKYLDGEFAIVLLDLRDKKIYFGRDSIGKRSLSYELLENEITISSVPTIGFTDCENKLYEYDLDSHELASHVLHNLPTYNENPTEPSEEELVKELYAKLKDSVFKRQDAIHPLKDNNNDEDTSKLAVLFSGGIDCTIVAALICQLTTDNHPIDLLTVGFENPRTNQKSGDSPDRQLATKSWFHLCQQFPDVNLRLIEINVDYKSWLLHKQRVRELMYPYNTEMDLSIAIAFYFASSTISDLTTKVTLNDRHVTWEDFHKNMDEYVTRSHGYRSNAKVLFSGLGADELFAGYSRHEAIFNTKDDSKDDSVRYQELQESLNYDISIIHQRNLSRDDRVISCWGKELRYPYLDENFINWVVSTIPPTLKFKYEYIPNKKNKMVFTPTRKYVLRKLAEYLDMGYVSQELKRAIQFGAKSAKLEIGQSKAKGTDNIA